MHIRFVFARLLFLAALLILPAIEANAQYSFTDKNKPPIITYDEIEVDVYIGADLSFSIDIIISNTDSIYVNVEELFNKLAIPCSIDNNGNTLSGFIENEDNIYEIDINSKQIKTADRTFYSQNGFLTEFGSIYIESSLLAEAFGITLILNPRSLYIELKTDIELPIYRQQRLEETRKNISNLQEKETPADTAIKRDYHLFKLGMLDWGISSTQSKNNPANNFFTIGLGTEFLYGEANFSVYYNNQYKFDQSQVNYRWRYVNNDNKLIRQASAGKIQTQSIAFLGSQVVGASITNSPTTLRKASGYYTISDNTEPNWTVELYINDQLVAFTTADASGMYLFEVPIVYGYTTLTLKFYGPLGEVRIEERTINLPYAILPAKKLEYNVSGGFLQDGISSRFAKAELNYGVSRIFTIAGGLEYLSSISTGTLIPYAKATLQPFSKLTLNAEYADGVHTVGRLSYYFWKNALLEFRYMKNTPGQQATIFYANEERWGSLYLPFKFKKFSGYLKVNHIQLVYSEFNYNQSNFIVSLYYKRFSANSSTHLNWNNSENLYISNDLALSVNLKKGYAIRTLAQYNISDNELMTAKVEIEKRIAKIYLSASYQRNLNSNTDYVSLNFRYNLPYARVAASAFYSNDNMSLSEGAQGSLAFGGDNYIKASNNPSVGKGGIMLYPFLDLNNNGTFDDGEHMVLVNSISVSGGRAIVSEKDSIARISELNAFANYNVEFNDFDLPNIAWQFTHKIYQIMVDPNQFKRVDVPIIVMGEADGMVYLKNEKGSRGVGRITIQIYDKEGKKVAETMSESDGYISYLGLKPGNYKACLDSAQLEKLNFTVSPICREFEIKTSEYGDIVDGIDFVLEEANDNSKTPLSSIHETSNTTPTLSDPIPQEISKDTPKLVEEPGYRVQLLAVKKPVDIVKYFATLNVSLPGLQIVETEGDDGYFRYSSGSFNSRADALILMNQIVDAGWDEAFISLDKSK